MRCGYNLTIRWVYATEMSASVVVCGRRRLHTVLVSLRMRYEVVGSGQGNTLR